MRQGNQDDPWNRQRTVDDLKMMSEAPGTGVVLLNADMQED